MKRDEPNVLVMTLREMLPAVSVGGGLFTDGLPSPIGLDREERIRVLASARRAGVDQLIQALMSQVGLGTPTPLSAGADGERAWPEGYVGSLTHKGGLVLGAIAPKTAYRSIGIDLERVQGDMSHLIPVIAPEGLPGAMEPRSGALLALSAKEAAYKAFHEVARKRLSYEDIRLSWDDEGRSNKVVATCLGLPPMVVAHRRVGAWVLTAAALGVDS